MTSETSTWAPDADEKAKLVEIKTRQALEAGLGGMRSQMAGHEVQTINEIADTRREKAYNVTQVPQQVLSQVSADKESNCVLGLFLFLPSGEDILPILYFDVFLALSRVLETVPQFPGASRLLLDCGTEYARTWINRFERAN